jgi:putative ABC transport system ATP-binding protein
MTREAVVEVRNLLFRYPDPESTFRLEVPEFRVGRGERVACIGPSGSGKTTLVNLATGILVPERGEVTLAGERIEGLNEGERRARRIRRVGMVFQEFELLDYLSARENILLPYLISSHLKRDAAVEGRVDEIATALGIETLLRRRPRELSQGERQRVAIGRALITEPELIVADEPTGNLDPRNAARILDQLFAAVSQRGAGLLVVTHDHSLLEPFDRVVDLAELRVEEAGA